MDKKNNKDKTEKKKITVHTVKEKAPAKHLAEKTEQEKSEKKYAPPRQLYRSETNKIIGGVAGGLGEYFNIDPVVIRLLFVLFTLIQGSGILLYLILWIILPSENNIKSAKNNPHDFRENIQNVGDEMKGLAQNIGINEKSNTTVIVGGILIIFGLLILLDNFGLDVMSQFVQLWPVLLILLGFAILYKK